LAEKDLDWESHHINLKNLEHLEPWYVELNPEGVVPTLNHDGKILTESNFIIEYLDEKFPEMSLRPDDPYERWQMRNWIHRFETMLHKNINLISFVKQNRMKRYEKLSEDELVNFLSRQVNAERRSTFEKRIRNGITDTEMQFAEDRISEVLDEMEIALHKKMWLNGLKLSLADISLAPFIERLEANKLKQLVDWDKRPALGSWWSRIQKLPSYKTAFDFTMP
jgi:glutathione S-transferase